MTVRQVFYQMVSRGAIDKTEGEYRKTVGRLLLSLRREHRISYDWIVDNTRWMRKPRTYTGLRDMLDQATRLYRRDLWQDQQDYVEVWLEKDALAGVLYAVTQDWGVPLMVVRGFSSETFLYSAAQAITDQIAGGKCAHIYFFGDLDPSGLSITATVERRLRDMSREMLKPPEAADHFFSFERVAVTREQVARWNLPTRPTKTTDTRSASFDGESVEVDAIPPGQLRDLVRECIEHHIDPDLLERTRQVEQAERESLANIVAELPTDA
jgi:hypothetical protein